MFSTTIKLLKKKKKYKMCVNKLKQQAAKNILDNILKGY